MARTTYLGVISVGSKPEAREIECERHRISETKRHAGRSGTTREDGAPQPTNRYPKRTHPTIVLIKFDASGDVCSVTYVRFLRHQAVAAAR